MTHEHDLAGDTGHFRLAFFLNLGFAVLELFGGLLTNSVAILADAIHDLGDSFALASAWYLERFSARRQDRRFSYGYRRFSLLGALITATVLVVGSLFILSEAVPRLFRPEAASAPGMLLFAVVGVAVNGFGAWRMSRDRGLNARVVTWHLLEDVLGWLAVLAVAIVLLFTDLYILDPLLSCLITLYVLANVVKSLRTTVGILMQGVPKEIDLDRTEERLQALPAVLAVHHTHAWSMDGLNHVFSTHLVIPPDTPREEIFRLKEEVRRLLREEKVAHSTVEIEFQGEACRIAPGRAPGPAPDRC